MAAISFVTWESNLTSLNLLNCGKKKKHTSFECQCILFKRANQRHCFASPHGDGALILSGHSLTTFSTELTVFRSINRASPASERITENNDLCMEWQERRFFLASVIKEDNITYFKNIYQSS